MAGDRVYLGSGVLSTTKILLASLNAYEQTLTLKDNQFFLLPLLRNEGTDDVTREDLFTLAQIFIHYSGGEISKDAVFMQVYTYNDLYSVAIKNTVGFAYPLIKKISEKWLGRLLVLQGYLHSNVSSTINVRLEKPNGSQSLPSRDRVCNAAPARITRSVRPVRISAEARRDSGSALRPRATPCAADLALRSRHRRCPTVDCRPSTR